MSVKIYCDDEYCEDEYTQLALEVLVEEDIIFGNRDESPEYGNQRG